MKTLNLVNPDASRINYKKLSFPDGQQNIIITSSISESVQIKSRLNNWLDLELITCAVASLRELGVEEIHLYTPYIMGARSDRKFEEGGNNYLKDVICPIINLLNFKSVTCIDPHIGAIYGDSITPERQRQIYERLAAKGFAATNIVLGVGLT